MWNKILIFMMPVGSFLLDYALGKFIDRMLEYSTEPREPESLSISGLEISGVEMLKALMTECRYDFSQVVDIFGSELSCSNVLAGQQPLTAEHIQKLSGYFRVSPLVFVATHH